MNNWLNLISAHLFQLSKYYSLLIKDFISDYKTSIQYAVYDTRFFIELYDLNIWLFTEGLYLCVSLVVYNYG